MQYPPADFVKSDVIRTLEMSTILSQFLASLGLPLPIAMITCTITKYTTKRLKNSLVHNFI